MTVLHKSSYAVRRLTISNKISKRVYSHLTQQQYRAGTNGTSETSQNKSAGWVVPAAIALLGLGFSTFSTHQLMSCSNASVVMGKK